MEELNYKKFKNIKKQLKKIDSRGLDSLAQTIFDLPKTKVYLVHEFDLQGRIQIVVIVRWWDGIRQNYNSEICVWDKESAMNIN